MNTGASGANITTNQSNYPLLVRLTAANFPFSQALSTGADLRFADSSGALLPYEIERFDATNKLAEIWVSIPTVYGNNNAQWFRMYWGKSTALSLSSGAAVFQTAGGYSGVWHLNDDGNTTTGGYLDASGYANAGTGIGLDASTDIAAVVGTGGSFATASNQGIHVPVTASLQPAGSLTIQTWFNQYSQGAYRRIAGRPYSSSASPWNEYDLELDGNGNKVSFSLTIGGTEAGYTCATTLNTATWYMAAGVYDGSAQMIYLNGVQEGSFARSGTPSDYGQPFAIGKYYHGTGSNWDGILDEVRMSTVARSADWLKLDYESMKAGSTVVTVGERSFDYAASTRFNFNTTSSGANVTGTDVTNIPILVRLSSANFDFSKTNAAGTDIKFVDKDGSNLYHEVVEWDKANTTGKVWVKVPQVDKNSTSDYITLYYGCATCTGNPYARSDSVWSGYKSVFHLASPETRANDAALLGNHGTYVQDMPNSTGLVSANAPFFDGTSTYIDVPNESNYDFTTNISASAWVKVSSFPSTWSPIVNKGDQNFRLHRDNGNNGASFAVNKSSTSYDAYSSTSINDGAWHYVTGTYDGANVKVYVDGVAGATAPALTGNIDNDNNAVNIGRNTTVTSRFWNGNLSEVRISGGNATVLSADFIKLSYENQKATSTLFSSTTFTTASFQKSKVYKFNTTASGANVSGDVPNIPILIRVTGNATGTATPIVDLTQSAGQDIRFLASDGVTWLDYQIERWDPSVDSGEGWGKVPVIHGNSASDFITMYFQQASGVTVPDGQCASCVFGIYKGVYHLSESPGGGAPQFTDASGNGNNATAQNGVAGDGVSTDIGKGFVLNGSSKYITTTTQFSNQQVFTNGVWFKTTSTSGGMLLGWDGGQVTPSGGHDRHMWMDNTGKLSVGTYNNGFQTITSGSAYNDGNWHFAVERMSGAGEFLFVDGASVASNTAYVTTENTNGYWRFGQGNTDWSPNPTSQYINATLDEATICHTDLSADWIKLSYQNQRRDATPLFNPSPADFAASRKYVFNTTKTGANVMGNVTNFPLLIRITGSTIVDAVQNNAPDIRFLDGDGKTWLNYQVERWDKAKDSAEVWVMVPQVDGNSDHDFVTLYYDDIVNGSVTNGECATCVFSTGNGNAAVWHLNNEFADQTGNGNTGTNNGTTSATWSAIAGGQAFNGSSQYITVANSSSLNPASAVTVSAWANPTSWAGGNRRILQKSTSGTDEQYILKEESSEIEFYTKTSGDNYTRYTTLPATGAWHLFAGTYDGTTRIIYVDGVAVSTETVSSAMVTATGALDIGRKPGTGAAGDYFNGYIDEARVDNVVRSADYIKLSYESQRPTGNVFWNSRSSPDNLVSLTATAGFNSISLSWNTPVSDSSNADSVGLWVKYTAYPDSATATSTTRVVRLSTTDTTYTYPATYPGTYYFALAVRNSNGAWSPFTSTSSDTAVLAGSTNLTDTVYVDSAIGNDGNTCTQARSPFTPKLTIVSANGCETNGVTDTLVVRVMPGTYTDNNIDPNSKPQVVTSFDNNSRAVLNGSGSVNDGGTRNATVILRNDITLRNMDVKCATNDYTGVYIYSADAHSRVEGCRIYNSGANKHYYGISFLGNSNNFIHLANNLIYQPNHSGIYITADNSFLIQHNTIVGSAVSTERAIYMNAAASSADMTITNNLIYNWDYGINTTTANIGTCANNLFFLVTSGREVTTTTCTGSIIKDPLFANTNPLDRNGFKLLPGSPAIDAGTTAYGTGGSEPVTTRSLYDRFGTARAVGSAPDIGFYEGTGYTPNPAGEFDTLTTSTTSTTATVENSKWKLIFDKANGGGINAFYDKTTAPATNLLASSSTLFDAKFDSYTASANSTFAPTFLERTRTRAIVRQRLNVSASLNVDITYSIYASGHIYVESELTNLSASTLTIGTVDYTLKLGTTTAAYTSAGTKNGFGYLTTSTRDAVITATRDLDAGASSAETWATSTAASGSPGTVVFNTTDLVDIVKNMKRRHDFLIYIGDNSLDFSKAAALNADAYAPSPLSASAGSLLLERSWQDGLTGHWTLDDGAGTTARDKAVYYQNNAAITGAGAKWVSGKVGAGLYLTATDVATVTDNSALEATLGMTLMFWIKPDFAGTGNTAYVISKGLTSSDGFFLRKVAGQSQFTFTMGAASVTSPTLTDGAWTHIALVCWSSGSKQIEMFVNGVLVAASTAAATATANASDLLFGYSAGGVAADKFQGTLDDIRIYKNEIYSQDIQSVYNRGFSSRQGGYSLRADNNNRVVALVNGGAAQTRIQPAFQITNWSGAKTPKYVYLNGTRLTPLTDYVVDSVGNATYGAYLVLQLNKVLTGADQTLFLDDDDSSGFMGDASRMKSLTMSAVASDKFVIKNFSDTVFGGQTSGQWYLELDLNGWITNTRSAAVDTGFGEFNVWKAAAINPNLAVSSSVNQVGIDGNSGRSLSHLKFDNTTTSCFSGGAGYLSPANISYTLTDSSATRVSMVLANMSLSCPDGTATLSKRFTVYPTGRIFASYVISSLTWNMDDFNLDIQSRYNTATTYAWGTGYATSNARFGMMGGDNSFHSIVGGLLSVKNNTSTYATAASFMSGASNSLNGNTLGTDYRRARLLMNPSLATSANDTPIPITVNYVLDISKDFNDSATADSLINDVQTPAVITAITGTRTTTDALDFNGDNFAEGDGAYTYAAAGGTAHFRFVNSVTCFNPAFRINTWTQGTLPEFVILDNQVLTSGYHFNAYLNAASGEVVIQFNKTLAPGTHVFYISHKNGLAVTLRAFEAKGGEGVDTLQWTTESEFENLGYNVYRRLAPGEAQIDSSLANGAQVAGAGIANALRDAARTELAKRAEAKLAKAHAVAEGDSSLDTLESQQLTPEELAILGYARVNPRLIAGAKGGSSAGTQNYRYLDRTANFGAAYEYLLEAVDFNANKVQYGPRVARPSSPLATELLSNYPNPFNPITTLRFTLKEKLKVSLVIYDSKGRLVRTLARPDRAMLPGKYRLIWDARNEGGIEVPSGQYFYRFTAGRYVKTRRMILVK